MGITHKERGLIFKLLGKNCKSLSMAHGQVWELEIKTKNLVKHTGGLCLAKDSERKGYYLRLYCLEQKKLLWELEIVKSTKYDKQKELLHSIIGMEYKIALNYFDEREAGNMLQVVTQTTEDLKLDKNDFNEDSGMSEYFEKFGYGECNTQEEEARKFVFEWVQDGENTSASDDSVNKTTENAIFSENTPVSSKQQNNDVNNIVNSRRNLINEELKWKMENLFKNSDLTGNSENSQEDDTEARFEANGPLSQEMQEEDILNKLKSNSEIKHETVNPENVILEACANFKSESTRDRKVSTNKQITKDDIGYATEFRHISHAGWDEESGRFVTHIGNHEKFQK